MSIPQDFIDPQVAAYFASRQATPAMALYERWKRGETIKVRTRVYPGELPIHQPVTFEIHPERFFGCGPVIGATVFHNGKPVEDHTKLLMSSSEFLEWMERLEAVEE